MKAPISLRRIAVTFRTSSLNQASPSSSWSVSASSSQASSSQTSSLGSVSKASSFNIDSFTSQISSGASCSSIHLQRFFFLLLSFFLLTSSVHGLSPSYTFLDLPCLSLTHTIYIPHFFFVIVVSDLLYIDTLFLPFAT